MTGRGAFEEDPPESHEPDDEIHPSLEREKSPGRAPRTATRRKAAQVARAARRERRARRKQALERVTLAGAGAVVAFLAPLLRIFGADPRATTAILRAQLLVEFRRERGATERNTFFMKLAGGVFLGSFLALGLHLVQPPPGIWMTVAQGLIFVFTVFATLEAVPHLVTDRRDSAVIASAPVRDLTFLVARILGVVVVVGLVIATQTFPFLVGGLVRWPDFPFTVLFTIASVLTGLLALFVTLIIYLGIVRVLPAQRARDAILFVQVAMTVGLFGAVQLGPHLVGTSSMFEMFERIDAARIWFPPYYAGEWFRAILGDSPIDPWLLRLAFIVPAAAGLGVLAIASGGVLARVRPIDGGGDERRTQHRPGILAPLVARIARHPTERAGYEVFRLLSRRERGFRLRTYPTLALSVIFGVGYLFNFLRDGPGLRSATPAMLAIPVYFAYLYAPIFVLQARYSDDGEAAWLFEASPIAEPGRLIAGMGLGLALCFLVPVAAAISVGVVWVGGLELVGHCVTGLAFITFATLFTVERVGATIPFSEPFRPQVGMTNFGLLMLTMIVQGSAIAVHFGMSFLPGGEWALAVIYLLIARRQLGRLRRMRPREVESRWFPGGRRVSGS